MNWSREATDYAQRWFSRRMPSFGARRGEIEQAVSACGEEEAWLLRFFYAAMPLVDVGDYPPALFREMARQALDARERFPWCRSLPEGMFLLYVAAPRVNTESLCGCRGLFRSQLEPRVAGLPLPQAILEVNRWCAQQASYRSTDDRTASPLQVYHCGWGRCGEESTFLVAALRSVGIAARQVYAPWWSHCDDNHAWVEAFDGEDWRYLGACEPEPLLDRGWFTHAAARAVMVHTRSFLQGSWEEVAFLFPQAGPLDLDLREGVAYENLTARYAPVRELAVEAAGQEGRPVPGAWVSLSVLNMAAPREVARRRTDPKGQARFLVGKGTLLATLWQEGAPAALGEALVGPQDAAVRLSPGRLLPEGGQVDFAAPPDGGLTVPPLPPALERARRQALEEAAALREARERPAPQPPAGEAGRLWQALSEKDRSFPLPQGVLEDGLAAFQWEGALPEDVFREGMLSPRIGQEELSPWRSLLARKVPPDAQAVAREDPRSLWQWVDSRVALEETCYSALWGVPQGMLATGGGTARGRALLFCAACRALGIPAKLVDGEPWFWQGGAFHPLWGEEPTARVCLSAPADQGGAPGQNYGLSRREEAGFAPLSTGEVPPGGALELSLRPGEYRLWTTLRLPGGGQLAQWQGVSLGPGESRQVELSFRRAQVGDLLERCPLPPFSLWRENGEEVPGGQALAAGEWTVLCFLEPGREPTEHLLNELREQAEGFVQVGCPLLLAVEDLSQGREPVLSQALEALPQAALLRGDFAGTVPALARRLFLDPGQLPLAVLANRAGEGLYGCCGYNVGTASLLLRLLRCLKNGG